MGKTTRQASSSARQAADSTALEVLARVGLVAYGIVHLLVGWLALQVAWGGSSENADQSGALQQLAEQPFGTVLLWVLAVGLAALAIWQVTEAIWGVHESERGKKLRRQATAGGKAVIYLLLGISAARFAMGSGQSSSQSQQDTTQGVLGWPGGQFIVAVAALVVIAVGGANIYRGVKKKFLRDLDTGSLPAKARRTLTRLGQFGHIAKGIALALVGLLLGYAAVTYDPEKATGLDGAMRTIVEQPFGKFLLTAVALGFVAFGIFAFAQARYRRM